jgi:DNA-binding CsgD family transcriptional regulator
MARATTISDVIAGIYDAGLDPSRWTDVVESISDYVGGQACGLFSKNSISKFGVTHYYSGADPRYIQLYAETYCKYDPLTTLPRFGDVVSIPDLVAYEEYRDGRFYQEWLRPQGCIDAANVVIENADPNCPVLMTVLSGKRMVDDEMRRRISHIVPHAHRALLINRAIETRQSEVTTFSDLLDGLSAGVFLVDARCRILHANAAGRDLLCSGDVLRSTGGQLSTRDTPANQTLRKHFAATDAIASYASNAVLPLTADNGDRYMMHMMPVQSVMRTHSAVPGKAVAALFVRRVEMDGRSCAELVARTFELTPAEMRVLLAIVNGGGVPETAKALGVAETTVKTHLQRIFAKTGASRQADLVKLTAGYASPLAS